LKGDALSQIIKRAAKQGASHFVLPARDNAKVAAWSSWIGSRVESPTLFLTGFGALGGSIQNAFAAASACPRAFAIVGRLITEAKKPGDAAKRLYEDIQSVRHMQPAS
jgi:orotidine-5'-phosphate decarboxylase